MSRPSGDAGDSLIELLLAIVILAAAAAVLMAGLGTAVRASDFNRKDADAAVYLAAWASAAENAVAGGGYAIGTGNYSSVYSVPSGFTKTWSAQCWNGTTWTGCSSGTDIGVQQVTFTVTSSDGRSQETLVVDLRQPCTPAQTLCTS